MPLMLTAAGPWQSTLGTLFLPGESECLLRSYYSLSLLLINPPRNA